MATSRHEWNKLNKDKIREYNKQYRSTHNLNEIYRTTNKKYHRQHRDELREYGRKWAKDNPERVKAQQDKPRTRFSNYKGNALRRKISFELTYEDHFIPEAPNTFWRKPCTYCHDKIDTIGLDRIDNSKGYTIDNVCPCCQECNWTRNDIWTHEEMLTIIGPAVAKAKELRRTT